MARKHQPEKLDDLYKAFEQNPGRRPGFIARLLRIPRSSVTRSLPALEDEGYFLSEDDSGRIWAEGKKKPFKRS